MLRGDADDLVHVVQIPQRPHDHRLQEPHQRDHRRWRLVLARAGCNLRCGVELWYYGGGSLRGGCNGRDVLGVGLLLDVDELLRHGCLRALFEIGDEEYRAVQVRHGLLQQPSLDPTPPSVCVFVRRVRDHHEHYGCRDRPDVYCGQPGGWFDGFLPQPCISLVSQLYLGHDVCPRWVCEQDPGFIARCLPLPNGHHSSRRALYHREHVWWIHLLVRQTPRGQESLSWWARVVL
mmetsp:Transcript_11703/g.20525  ORF Transcript_11703/g.20525 Transcript_11703/m.20525 type:complete len:234 (-) Transcript_11703:209-910(-)